jgi:hypothetical protein
MEDKWKKFLRIKPLFSLVPFVDLVLVSGSLALGKAHEDSDFDVIVGCRKGRIFTTRFFSHLVFGLRGVRRKGSHTKNQAKDKICLSHFVVPSGYLLAPPHNPYWKEMYRSLVPVFGKEDSVRKFFSANQWSGKKEVVFDHRWQAKKFNLTGRGIEFFLQGSAGDFFESLVKKMQVKKIEKNIEKSDNDRVIYNDDVIEFHMLKKSLPE